MNIDHDQLARLIELLRDANVHEFEHEDENVRVRLVMNAPAHHVQSAPVVSIAPGSAVPAAAASIAPAADASVVNVTSPFVGTFYRAAKPGAPAYADVGKRVVPGTPLCIIEAMKLMNELEAEVTGTVVEVLAENGKPVEYGQVLFRVRKES